MFNRTESFKIGLSPSPKIHIICVKESRLKMMKSAFYFILKALQFSFSRHLNFCLGFLFMQKKRPY